VGVHPVTRAAVFLDRDGVLNRAVVREGKPYPPSGPDQLEIPEDVPDALARLRAAHFDLVVVTNQPDVARGTQTIENVEEINTELRRRLPLDDVRVCYHDDRSLCDCRKPLPGLLLAAARDRQLDLSHSFMVGDRWRDVEAGRRAGCRTVLIDCDYHESVPTEPDVRVRTLGEAATWILDQPITRSDDVRGRTIAREDLR